MSEYSTRMNGLSGSATREILKLTALPDMISFAGGLPATQCLPVKEIREITADILSGAGATGTLQYGLSEGVPAFREQLKDFLSDVGIKVSSTDNLFVVSGGQQGIDLMCKVFLDKGDVVLVENPTYLAFLQIAATYEARVVGVESDKQGLVLSDLEEKIKKHKPKFIYVVPTFSNPTGRSYTAENRRGIAYLADKYGVMVLEDDPYSRLRFTGDFVPALKSYDISDKVVYVTSFSKILSPGLRVAVMTGGKEVIRKLVIAKQGTDLHTASLSQLIACEYLKRGYLKPDIEKSLPVYRTRKEAMTRALDEFMPEEFHRTDPEGGLFIWGEFSVPVDAGKCFDDAVKRNVAYVPGSVFYADGKGQNTLRLNYSNADEEKIRRGVKALGEMFKQKISEVK